MSKSICIGIGFSGHLNPGHGADMQNVKSVASAACVTFQSWDKLLALKIRWFVKNSLSVSILRCSFVKWLALSESLSKKIDEKDEI